MGLIKVVLSVIFGLTAALLFWLRDKCNNAGNCLFALGKEWGLDPDPDDP